MTERRFVIVENDGYDGEKDITHFPTLRQAFAYQADRYTPDEIESLHVDIRQDWQDENGEWQGEYVY